MIGAKQGGKSSDRTVLRRANAESSYSIRSVQPSSSPDRMELVVSFREEPCYGQTLHTRIMVLSWSWVPGLKRRAQG